MNDKQFVHVILFCGIGGLIWWWLNGKINSPIDQAAATSPDDTGGYIENPTQAAWNPNLAFGTLPPQTMGSPDSINVNIANQGLNYLNNNYIPLFGFVGMAQGSQWIQ